MLTSISTIVFLLCLIVSIVATALRHTLRGYSNVNSTSINTPHHRLLQVEHSEELPLTHGHSHNHEHTTSSHDEPSYCQREWPRIELYLPLGLRHNSDEKLHAWENVMLRSLLLYWPVEKSNISLTFIIDEEMEDTVPFYQLFHDPLMKIQQDYYSSPSRIIRNQFPRVSYHFHRHPNPLAWNKTTNQVDYTLTPYVSGYGRQQYLGFVADLYSDAPYIGMIDDDTQFSTFLDREDLFTIEDGIVKPQIRGQLKIFSGFYFRWMQSNYIIMKREMPMNCMSYFPVLIKREHFSALREYLMKLHNQPDWDSVFKHVFPHNYNDGAFSQFCVICTYIFWFHRKEYAWRLLDKEPNWDGNSNPRPPNGHFGNKLGYSMDERTLRPLIASHAFYRDPARFPIMHCSMFKRTDKQCKETMAAVYLQGACCNPAFRHSLAHSQPDPSVRVSLPSSANTTTNTPEQSLVASVNCSIFFERYEYNSEVYGFEGWQYEDNAFNRSYVFELYHERLARFRGCDLSYGIYELQRLIREGKFTEQDISRFLAMKLRY